MELKAREAHIPEGWHEVTVEDLKAPTDNALSTGPFGSSIGSRFFEPHGVPVIRGCNLATDGSTRLIDDGFVFVSEAKAREFRRSVVTSGDLVFTCWGTINQVGLIGPRAAYSRYVISNKQMKFTADAKKADGLFLFYLFSGPELQRAILDQGIGSSVPGFNLGQLRALRLKLPPLPEQRAIAGALGDVDALLGALTQLIAKKRDLKQSAMQQLLTGQTRLPGFSGKWEVKRLGDLFSFSGGRTASRDQLSERGLCYLHYGDIHKSTKPFIDVKAEYIDIPKLDVPLAEVPASALLHDGDVVFVDASEDDEGTSKHVVVVNVVQIPYIAGLHTIVARSRSDALDSLFKCYCFQSQHVKRQFHFYAAGTKVSGISKTNIAKIFLTFPPAIREQIAIAAVLSDMDAEIAALEQRLAKTRALKQGMMQELLTGRTRLV